VRYFFVFFAIENWKRVTTSYSLSKMRQFGEKIEGYDIPVLNEREVRASAGILLLGLSISIARVAFIQDFLLLKYFVIAFLTDFIIRIFVSHHYSPTLIIGRLIVRNQTPEYVGAAQKKFAWIIGLGLATVMFFLLVVINLHSFITGSACIVCLIFLFFESAFGICLGCLVYPWFYKEKARYCPGEICDKQDELQIQKTSMLQILIVFAFMTGIALIILLFNDIFRENPGSLFGN
jgi:hypothetical protein